MKLYGHPMSTCTRKVLATLAEKGHKAEFVLVDIMKGEAKSPEHLARQPFGVVPSLDDGGYNLYESRAICRYLDETLPGAKLTPDNAKDRGHMEQWISVEASYFSGPAMKVVMTAMFGPMMGKPVDEAAVKAGREGVERAAKIMDANLAGKDYLVGKQFTIADICFLPYIEYLFACNNGDTITSHKNLASWWTRCSERKSWRIATGKETAA